MDLINNFNLSVSSVIVREPIAHVVVTLLQKKADFQESPESPRNPESLRSPESPRNPESPRSPEAENYVARSRWSIFPKPINGLKNKRP
jgi:hypothetical protein